MLAKSTQGYYAFTNNSGEADNHHVGGGYEEWSEWTSCSVTCGEGKRKRHRLCNNPAPSNGGFDCSRFGKSEDIQFCFKGACPIGK